jgi:hypothetical protein
MAQEAQVFNRTGKVYFVGFICSEILYGSHSFSRPILKMLAVYLVGFELATGLTMLRIRIRICSDVRDRIRNRLPDKGPGIDYQY